MEYRNEMVSIVVPVFRVEEYIEKCIYSLINQTYTNIEIIIVNDGTDDDSINIAERILKQSTIDYKIINQKNKGVSSARNIGIEQAKGDWIITIDPDDIIQSICIENLLYVANQLNVDVVACNYENISVDEMVRDNRDELLYKKYSQEEILDLYLKRKLKLLAPGMLIRKNSKSFYINYDENIIFAEDVHYIWRVLIENSYIGYVRNTYYKYLIRPNSTVTSSNLNKIMNGYSGFVNFKMEISERISVEFSDLLMARWVLAALHLGADTLNKNDFKKLAEGMDYKEYLKKLSKFPCIKVKILSLILRNVNINTIKLIMRGI